MTKRSVRKETTETESFSLGELIVSEAGLFVLVRFAAIASTAFLAGAVVQRILLAKFAVKVGPFELKEPELNPAEVKTTFDDGISALRQQLAALKLTDPSGR